MSAVPVTDLERPQAAGLFAFTELICSRLKALPLKTWILVLLVAAAHLPLILSHFQRLWSQPQYQCFPIILVGAALLAWRAESATQVTAPSLRWLWALAGFAWVTLAAGVLLNSAWLGMLATLLLVSAAAYRLGGFHYLRRYWQAGLMLGLLFPPPLGLDQRLVASMQRLASYSSSAMLDLLGIPHVRHGNVIETVNRNLLVEEACSGIDSMVTGVACTLFFVLWVYRPRLHSALLLLSTVAWVLLANIVRITLVAYLDVSAGIDVATGWKHQLLGAGIFLIALLLIGSTDQLLCFLLGTHEMPASPSPVVPPPSPAPAPAFCLPQWPLGLGYGLLFLAQLGVYGPGIGKISEPQFARVPALGAELLPRQAGPFRRMTYHVEPRGTSLHTEAYSQLWEYESDRARLHCSLDYPFVGWHELSICYRETGWSIVEQSVIEDDSGQPVIELTLQQAPGRTGLVLFQSFAGDGRAVTRPGTQGLGWRLGQGFGRLLGYRAEDDPTALARTTTYQAQLLMENAGPMTRDDVKAARQLFQRALPPLRSELAKQMGSSNLARLEGATR